MFFDPIVAGWERDKPAFPNYAAGSWAARLGRPPPSRWPVVATALEPWHAEGVRLAEVDAALARLRAEATAEGPSMRTSVMTHRACVPHGWREQARAALEGMAERHPPTIILFPEPNAGDSRIDARASVERWEVPDTGRGIVTETIELTLRGDRAKAPASVVQELLISDLPVFLRWRGEPPWRHPELEQLVDVVDRLIVDSTEWDDLPHAYTHLAACSPAARRQTSRGRGRRAGARTSRRCGRELPTSAPCA